MKLEVSARRTAIAAGTLSCVMIATVWHAFGGPSWLFLMLVAGAALFIAAEYRHIPPKLRHTALILFATSAALLPFARSPLEALQRGLFVSGLLLSLMVSIMLLAHCALRSAHIRSVGSNLRGRRPRTRYAWFTAASQIFSAMLGMAGANIVLVMAAPPNEQKSPGRTATVTAVMRGFSAACLWSPVVGNMAIMLALYPTLHWAEVFPVGVALAQITVIVGVVMDRFGRGAASSPAPAAASTNEGLGAVIPVLLAMLAFLALLLTASRLLHVSVSVAILIFGPLVALALNIAMSDPGARVAEGLRHLWESARQLSHVASEAMVFTAAGCAGSILADAFPAEWVARIGELLGVFPLFGVGFLMLGIMAVALAGIHPVLTGVFMASTITPEVLHLPPIAHISAIIAGWALSSCVTPYSVLTLVASRYAGDGLYQISLGRNWAFALISAALSCLLLTAVALALR